MTKVRTPNPLVIIVVRKDILLMCAGVKTQINMSNLRTWVNAISAKSKVIRHMNAKPKPCMHQDLKVIAIIVKNMDIEPLNAIPSPHSHQKSQ